MRYIKNLLMIVMIVMLMGCNHFEISNEINPKLTIIGRDIGLLYKLGNLTISDTWEGVNKEKIEFLKNTDDLVFTLFVSHVESNSSLAYFNYYVNGVIFQENHTVPSATAAILIANRDSIEGFHLYRLDNEIYENNEICEDKEVSDDIKKEKEKRREERREDKDKKLIKKVKENQGNRYQEPDDKW